MRTYGAAILSGLLVAGSFPPLDCGWLAWIALVPLFLTLPHLRLRTALRQAALFGVVYFGALLYWLVVVGARAIGVGPAILAWTIAITAQTLFMAAFGLGAALLARHPRKWLWQIGVPALWALLEWLRQLGDLGTTWGDLSVSQHAMLPVLQLSKLTGVWGVSFLVVLVNVAIAEVAGRFGRSDPHPNPVLGKEREPDTRETPEPDDESPSPLRVGRRACLDPQTTTTNRPRQAFPAAVAVTVGLVVLAGLVSIHSERLRPTFVAAALQPDISPNVDWYDGHAADPIYFWSTIERYVAGGDQAAGHGATVVVWPEATFPAYLRDDPAAAALVQGEAQRDHQTILVGTPEHEHTGHDGNALTQVTPSGAIGRSYVKRHLVPFGEYVPYSHWFKFLDFLHLTGYDRQRGAPVQPLFATPIGPVGAVICYESSYPELTREEVARGAGLLAIVTDDTWYGRTAAPKQHANFAALRAVETDRYVVRAAATGISEIIDPTGRVIQSAPLFTTRVLTAPVESRHTVTSYVRFGDWFPGTCALLLVYAIVTQGRKRRF
jgi:apolipoprotein N-acyltransferase